VNKETKEKGDFNEIDNKKIRFLFQLQISYVLSLLSVEYKDKIE